MKKHKKNKNIAGTNNCLVCLSDTSAGDLSKDVLKDVAPLFGISDSSWSTLRSPESSPGTTSCCTKCSGAIEEAKTITDEVSRLQANLRSLLEDLKNQLRQSYQTVLNQNQLDVDEGQSIRQALVQCWTPCKVSLEKLPGERARKRKRLEAVKNEADLDAVDRRDPAGGSFPDVATTDYEKPREDVEIQEKRPWRDRRGSLEERKNTFQCQYCRKTYKKSSFFRKEYNRFIFRCELPGCTQTAQNFMVFGKHHEAQCPRNPESVNWRPRQKGSQEKAETNDREGAIEADSSLMLKAEAVGDSTKDELGPVDEPWDDEFFDGSLVSSLVSHGMDYLSQVDKTEGTSGLEEMGVEERVVEAGDMKSNYFHCKHCQKDFYKGSFFRREKKRFIFKCEVSECVQVAQNFMIFGQHHEAHCPRNPSSVFWKPRKKPGESRSEAGTCEDSGSTDPDPLSLLEFKMDTSGNSGGKDKSSKSNKKTLRGNHPSFVCKYCQTEYQKESFFQKEYNRYIFKCDLPNCTKIAQNFMIFGQHHEAQCPGNPDSAKWRPRQKPSIAVFMEAARREDARNIRNAEGHLEPSQSVEDNWFAENVLPEPRTADKMVKSILGLGRAKNIFLDSFQCKYCGKEYKKADYFQKKSRNFVFKCELPRCTKVTKNFLIFRQHHQGTCPSKPLEDTSCFKCKHCTKEYRKSSYYIPETRRFIFKCDQPDCAVVAQNFPILRRHHEATCPERPPPETFSCVICDRAFVSIKTLRNHQISFHTQAYNYFCEKCGVGAVSAAALNVHMLVHSERKHKCPLCPATFRRKQHLLNHDLRLHSQSYPHMCETCGKTFSVRQGLRMHLHNVHGTIGTGTCPICKKTFKSPHYVRNHIWSTHRRQRKPKSTLKKGFRDPHSKPGGSNRRRAGINTHEGDERDFSDSAVSISIFPLLSAEDVAVTVGY